MKIFKVYDTHPSVKEIMKLSEISRIFAEVASKVFGTLESPYSKT
jgi:hypothetical protein